ncbi:hypothetical protein OTU49_008296 [Cherax quadricarinatus]|uniref:Uncharacterized protein n=1 Tax=Cherax quadricarinatus TaxID=27406 RepID=A0AAW0WQW0_CHEQU
MGEIDATERTVEGAVEGLICEVDADALPIRPSSVSSDFNEQDHNLKSRTSSRGILSPSRLQDHSLTSEEEPGVGAAAIATPAVDTIKKESVCTNHDSFSVYTNHDSFSPTVTVGSPEDDNNYRHPSTKRPRTEGNDIDQDDDRDDQEFLQLEKRRVYLQECQLRLLHDIYRQMQTDSERNHAFQQAFLDIERQRLELEKSATSK